MTTYRRLRPSAAEAWMNCALSPHLSEGVADTAGEPAREGTRVHFLIETCLRNGEWGSDNYIGAVLDVPGLGEFKVTGEQSKSADVMLRHVAELMALDRDAELYAETSVHAYEASPQTPWEVAGTSDCILLLPTLRRLHVIDYKNGFGVVEVDENKQALNYGMGALRRFHNREFDTVVLTIVQPRATHVDGPVRSKDYDRLELFDFKTELADAVAAIASPAPAAKVGPWCDKCKGAFKCEALRAFADGHKVNMFGEVVHPTGRLQEVGKIMDAAELGRRLNGVRPLKAYIDAIEKHAFATAVNGSPPFGFKLVAGRDGNRRWTREPDAICDVVWTRTGADITEKSVMSPTQVEKLLGKPAMEKLADLIERPPGSPTLVPDENNDTWKADKRPAITVDRASAFDKVQHKD